MNINIIESNLYERGFRSNGAGSMVFAEGSISNYRKCSVCFEHRLWGDMAQEWFYSVRFESFAESGQPELDHHTMSELYVAESEILNYVISKGILTKAEREARIAEFKKRMRRG